MQIKKVIFNFDLILAGIALVGLCGTVILQIILRQIFQRPLMGAEELTRYLVIWVIVTPLAYTEKLNGHIVMEELQSLFPEIVKKIIRVICSVSTTVVYVLITLSAISVWRNNMQNMTATLKIPFWLFFMPSVIGFAGISILRIANHIYKLFKKEPPWASL